MEFLILLQFEIRHHNQWKTINLFPTYGSGVRSHVTAFNTSQSESKYLRDHTQIFAFFFRRLLLASLLYNPHTYLNRFLIIIQAT